MRGDGDGPDVLTSKRTIDGPHRRAVRRAPPSRSPRGPGLNGESPRTLHARNSLVDLEQEHRRSKTYGNGRAPSASGRLRRTIAERASARTLSRPSSHVAGPISPSAVRFSRRYERPRADRVPARTERAAKAARDRRSISSSGSSTPPTCIVLRPTPLRCWRVDLARPRATPCSPSGSTRRPIRRSSIAWPKRIACRCSTTVRTGGNDRATCAGRGPGHPAMLAPVGSRRMCWKPDASSCARCRCGPSTNVPSYYTSTPMGPMRPYSSRPSTALS